MFSNYFVADSLCCPSRSSIFTGLFPHDTKVATNLPPDGGFLKFQSEGLDTKTFAVALQRAGYATSMLGKYLNGYGDPLKPKTAPVPPGWSDWHVSNSTGYAEFNFVQNDNGTFNRYRGPANYGVDVLDAGVQSFIKRAVGTPF
ncbi:MAG: N-acetylglucosamine-6-sulfatase, partial [Actinomycetota bacterium]|nr:N-acetylglucosamine-6-sulfatase [Actinomycetota bacterium]